MGHKMKQKTCVLEKAGVGRDWEEDKRERDEHDQNVLYAWMELSKNKLTKII